MGFWDSVAGLAKNAGKAVQEKAQEQQYETWKKLVALPQSRLLDVIEQNADRRQLRSLAILALSLKSSYEARSFLDEDIRGYLERLRRNLALEDNRYAEEQRRAIDSLL